MDRLWTLAINTFQEILRRKVIYILVFLGVLFAAGTLYGLVYMEMASEAGEVELLTRMRSQFVVSLFEMTGTWCSLLAVFLGSVALATELKNRTIVPVLSRPVERWQFLLAKWLGTLGFLALFLGAGCLAALALAWHWQLTLTPIFALGVAELFLEAAVLTGVSLGLSSLVNPVLAGGGSLLLVYLSYLTDDLARYPYRALKLLASAGYFLSPAQMPEALLQAGLTKGLADPDYGLYAKVLAENALYALAAVIVGALVFRRKEIALK